MKWFLFIGICAVSLLFVHTSVTAQELTPTERKQLEAEYDQLQEEIASWEKVLAETRAKKSSLQGDVTALNAEIKQAEAQIRQKNLAIGKINTEINAKTKHISELESRIDKGKQSLAALIRQKNQIEDLSFVEIALASDNAFSLFEDVDNMIAIQRQLADKFTEIRTAQDQTAEERELLSVKQDEELDARHEVEVKKEVIQENEAEKKNLLTITANQEVGYEQVLADRQAKASAIRARLFPLRDSEGIQFGEAVQFAQEASKRTGVRAALILAILKQESDLGTNVGNCYVTNSPGMGDGVGKNTGTAFPGVMHPTRDVPVFLKLVEALGKDFKTTPVSCPQGGWGGAMGPTQFIPSTWVLFEARIKAALGVPATNPWNAEHAITATSLYLSDWSAGLQTYTAERDAACAYFSGRKCPGTGNWVDTYGTSVVNHATAFQKEIDFLKDN